MSPVFVAVSKRILMQFVIFSVSKHTDTQRFRALTQLVHTMQVPYLDSQSVILAMVHHIRVKDRTNIERLENEDEKVFICMLGLGLDGEKPKALLGEILVAYQENACLEDQFRNQSNDHSNDNENGKTNYKGVTPKLFVAAVLKQYGFEAAKEQIRNGFKRLKTIDDNLKKAGNLWLADTTTTSGLEETSADLNGITRPEDARPEDASGNQKMKLSPTIALRQKCVELNKELNVLLNELTGVRSRVHYIGLSARCLMREESEIERYITESWYRFLPVPYIGKVLLYSHLGSRVCTRHHN